MQRTPLPDRRERGLAMVDDPVIVVTNPEEDCSPAAFREFLDELLEGPAPEIESLDGAAAVRALRGELEG